MTNSYILRNQLLPENCEIYKQIFKFFNVLQTLKTYTDEGKVMYVDKEY